MALLGQLSSAKPVLPSAEDAATTSITCAVCHSPHENTLASQLRYPEYSTNNFSYSTSTNTTFAIQHDPKIQLCGQCHNMRGARWQDTGRPPHHSTQYNLLIGQGGYDLGNVRIHTHGRSIQKQCAHCHTHPHEVEDPDENNPNYTGHKFEPTLRSCATAECHDSEDDARDKLESLQESIKTRMKGVQDLLNQWSATKAPPALTSRTNMVAWEYASAGQLSPGKVGPAAADQTAIPDAIKQARFNLYLVEHDASYGLHNPRYTRYLLDVAKTNVTVELAKP
jgi:hypothetical protein